MIHLCDHQKPSMRGTYRECTKKHLRCTLRKMLVCEETIDARAFFASIIVIMTVITLLVLSW